VVVREADYVVRLAYTRSQAAEALGISRSTLRRLLPYLETIELPWGAS
jgi:response regulator of citrate/malate metabolism